MQLDNMKSFFLSSNFDEPHLLFHYSVGEWEVGGEMELGGGGGGGGGRRSGGECRGGS